MKKIYFLLILLISVIAGCNTKNSPDKNVETAVITEPFKVLVLTERGGQHGSFTDTAMVWIDAFSKEHNFEYTEINNTEKINKEYLSEYKAIIQLDFPPYTWTKDAEEAFIEYIERGKGGWVGFHHATLLGEFDGYPLWQWFSDFMGGIQFKNYIAATASAKVNVEDKSHPVMAGVEESFILPDDEWYTFDKSPRENVHVLANVDEASYEPMSDIKMGDHPAVWTNEKVKACNVYFLMGHANTLFHSDNFTKMFGNAIIWAAKNEK